MPHFALEALCSVNCCYVGKAGKRVENQKRKESPLGQGGIWTPATERELFPGAIQGLSDNVEVDGSREGQLPPLSIAGPTGINKNFKLRPRFPVKLLQRAA